MLFNMATGFSTEIISYSNYYKFNIVAVFILVFINVALNFYVLTQTNFGIVGVSVATLISLVIFNVAKLLFIYKKMKIIPFDKNYGKLILIMIAILLAVKFLPKFNSNWLEIILKIGFILILSIGITYKLKLMPTLNFWVDKILKK